MDRDLETTARLRIATRRNLLGLSQVELAQRVGGMDGTAVTRIERGQRRIRLNEAAEIAGALGVDLMYLVGPVPAELEEYARREVARRIGADLV
jgi:transcriptional regulator with XRE-family HTH domain